MLTWHLEWIILIKQKLRKLLKSHQKVPAVYQKRRHSISYKLKRKGITHLYGCRQWDKWVQRECLLASLLKLLCWVIFPFPPLRECREGISKDCFPRTRSPFISPVTSPPYDIHCHRASANLFKDFYRVQGIEWSTLHELSYYFLATIPWATVQVGNWEIEGLRNPANVEWWWW